MVALDWRGFLQEWSRALLASPAVAAQLPRDVVTSRWLGYTGATEEQLARAEARLGTRLPPSYREFLQVSNGWRQLTPFIDQLWSTDEIEWFAVRNQQWIDAYTHPIGYNDLPPVSDTAYYVYGEAQDCVAFRPEYLTTALEISAVGDSAIYLLNRQVVTPDGEWEAWFFANWLPGANRYRSFQELMQAEYQRFLRLRDVP